MTGTYNWRQQYEAALVETDRALLPNLIQVAQAAIDARIAEIRSDRAASPDEQQAIADALSGLHVLRREIH